MKFLLDENTEYRLGTFLKTKGHDVTAIAYDYPWGLKDHQVLAIAQNEQRILITNDRDFGKLIFHQNLPHSGVIFFRMKVVDLSIKEALLNRVLIEHANELTHFIVVTRKSIRVRQTKPSAEPTHKKTG